MPPPVPGKVALGFAWRILLLSNFKGDDIYEREEHSLICYDVKGGTRLPISCLNLCSFSLAIFEFLCPSATCWTSSLISFSSCSLCSAYFLISSAVYKRNSTSMHNYKYIPKQLRVMGCKNVFTPHTVKAAYAS